MLVNLDCKIETESFRIFVTWSLVASSSPMIVNSASKLSPPSANLVLAVADLTWGSCLILLVRSSARLLANDGPKAWLPRPNKNRPIMPVKIKRAYAMNKRAGIAANTNCDTNSKARWFLSRRHRWRNRHDDWLLCWRHRCSRWLFSCLYNSTLIISENRIFAYMWLWYSFLERCRR